MMKAVFNLLLLPLALIVLFTQCKKEPEIELVDISDDAFLNALIEEGVDTNGDGLISSEEAEAVISLYVGSAIYIGDGYRWRDQITSLEGIEAFVNLDSLNCSQNLLTYLNVSDCAF